MSADNFATFCRRIRLTNDPIAPSHLRTQLDRGYPTGRDPLALLTMITLKRARRLQAS